MKSYRTLLKTCVVGALAGAALSATAAKRPNIIFILADDMGFGSVSANNPKSEIQTPRLDRMMAEGMNFTDAHSDSAVCSPSRYGLLTGRYSWRSGLKSGVTWAYFPALIEEGRVTVADMLRDAGYDTGMVGKWHLGLDFTLKNGKTIAEDKNLTQSHFVNCGEFTKVNLQINWKTLDFTQPIKGGPFDHGFSYYFGDDLPNMPPYVFYKNNELMGMPSVPKPNDMFGLPGPMVPGWTLEAVMPAFVKDATRFIEEKAKADDPFFLYFALNSPHTPISPSEEFIGSSGINDYADWMIQTDAAVGSVLDTLKAQGIDDNTLVIFSTDNGTSYADKGAGKVRGMLSHQFRGAKRSIYEGGHRVPYIVRWPGVTPAGSVCDETICLNDFMATAANIAGVELADHEGPDSNDILALYQGESREEPAAVIHHDFWGGYALRKGDWKLVLPLDRKTRTFTRELYNIKADIKETKDVIASHPEVAANLERILEAQIREGRSTTGSTQSNWNDSDWMLPFAK